MRANLTKPLVATGLVLMSFAIAQPSRGQSPYEWIQVQGSSPPDRTWELGYDKTLQLTIACMLITGPTDPDTWTWNGSTWTNTGFHGPTFSVEPVYYAASGLVYHDHLGVVYRMQRFDGLQPMATWTFIEGAGWIQVDSDGPISSEGFGWAYDSARQKSVMYGGRASSGAIVAEFTWEWDGFTWTRHDPFPDGPERREYTAMAYDAKRGVAVMFGGRGEDGYLGDTWTWDGEQWQQHVVSGPGPRWMHSMIYDPQREKVLLFGGREADYMNDLWEWNGFSWTQIPMTGGPSPRARAGFTFDEARGEAVLYSGSAGFGVELPHTWRLRIREAWVDFDHTGTENGRFNTPFNTVAEAVNSLPPEGRVRLKPGTTAETITISKQLRLDAPLGTATIGRP